MKLNIFLMEKTKLFVLLIISTLILILPGCNKKSNGTQPTDESLDGYVQKITGAEAKKIMDEDKNVIIVDVRTLEEYQTGYISGATLIPLDEISNTAESKLTNKNATILVYCRSGRRSEIAAQNLFDLGYTNIYDFGGILDWNYDIVTK